MKIFELEFTEEKKTDKLNYLKYEDKDIILNACVLGIGKEHPFIENVSATMWYQFESSGVYINGYDKNNKMNFIPIFNENP